jgi:uncharacterized protein YjiS (DUF1127 family)
MNDQSATRAALLSAIAAMLSSLIGVVRAIIRRRRRALLIDELMQLDDTMLADIGLHRSEIRAAVIAAERGVVDRRRCR